ncbi:MAG TPA: tetratricopeptide repeat protein [Acidobacteriaceae bacterium]|nr:tetratricopeptide repeat protein [Acidobacteriaceae bacterium]
MLKKFLLPGSVFVLASVVGAMSATTANPVRRDLNLGRADVALESLDTVLAQAPSDAVAHNLRCRVYYEEQHWDQAIADCQAAVLLDTRNSDYHLWLGRAYGQKAASISSLLAAYKLAHKVAAEFRQAVQLDPQNAAALSDLGEFDVRAPHVAGGGINRAQAVLQQLRSVSLSDALILQGRIAEKKKDYPAAEADYRAAIAQTKDPASAWMDLASFYLRCGRTSDAVTAAYNGAAIDRQHGPALVQGATDLDATGRDPGTAIQWLREYLASPAQSEEAPAFAVHAQLARLLENQGDELAAQQQLAEVHALASGYRIPAPSSSAWAGR